MFSQMETDESTYKKFFPLYKLHVSDDDDGDVKSRRGVEVNSPGRELRGSLCFGIIAAASVFSEEVKHQSRNYHFYLFDDWIHELLGFPLISLELLWITWLPGLEVFPTDALYDYRSHI